MGSRLTGTDDRRDGGGNVGDHVRRGGNDHGTIEGGHAVGVRNRDVRSWDAHGRMLTPNSARKVQKSEAMLMFESPWLLVRQSNFYLKG